MHNSAKSSISDSNPPLQSAPTNTLALCWRWQRRMGTGMQSKQGNREGLTKGSAHPGITFTSRLRESRSMSANCLTFSGSNASISSNFRVQSLSKVLCVYTATFPSSCSTSHIMQGSLVLVQKSPSFSEESNKHLLQVIHIKKEAMTGFNLHCNRPIFRWHTSQTGDLLQQVSVTSCFSDEYFISTASSQTLAAIKLLLYQYRGEFLLPKPLSVSYTSITMMPINSCLFLQLLWQICWTREVCFLPHRRALPVGKKERIRTSEWQTNHTADFCEQTQQGHGWHPFPQEPSYEGPTLVQENQVKLYISCEPRSPHHSLF